MKVERPAQPEPDLPEMTSSRRRSGTGLRALARSLATVAVPLAVCYLLLSALPGRAVDLFAFLLALFATASLAVLLWRLHGLFLLLDGQRRQSRDLPAAGPDPLARLVALPLWRDSRLRPLLAGAIASNVAVFAYVSAKYESLPPFLPLHYSATGDVDRLGTPPEVFMMPAIGVVVLVANVVLGAALYRRERLASHLLVGASIFVQMVLLVATATIVSRA